MSKANLKVIDYNTFYILLAVVHIKVFLHDSGILFSGITFNYPLSSIC